MSFFSVITFIICVGFGIFSIIKDIPDETIEKWNQNFFTKILISKYFKNGKRIHNAISKSVKSANFSDSIKFMFGIIYVFLYFFIVNLGINLVKLIIFALTNNFAPNFFEGFSFLFGAGLAAFYLWFAKLKDQTYETKSNLKEKKIFLGIKSFISHGAKFYVIILSYILWVILESLFLAYSIGFEWVLRLYLFISIVMFLIYILLSLILALFGRPKKENEGNKVNEGNKENY